VQVFLQLIVRRVVELFPPHLGNELRRLGGVTVGARARLIDELDALRVKLILQRVGVTAILVVILAEGVARPDARHRRHALQLTVGFGTTEGRWAVILGGLLERVVLHGEIQPPHRRVELISGDLHHFERILGRLIFLALNVHQHGDHDDGRHRRHDEQPDVEPQTILCWF
jgi:hypothetical protein